MNLMLGRWFNNDRFGSTTFQSDTGGSGEECDDTQKFFDMDLGIIMWIDRAAFVVFLIPQLILQVGIVDLATCLIGVLPFLGDYQNHSIGIKLVLTLLPDRNPPSPTGTLSGAFVAWQSGATLLRPARNSVRYAFAKIPASVGKGLFSAVVALPFIRFRMLRQGHLQSPIYHQEISGEKFTGIFAVIDKFLQPDVVLYYIHRGGFSMAFAHFYIEFLLVWFSMLKQKGYNYPAPIALNYTLVPEVR